MFSKYYQSELAYLREMGREFGVANPSLAGLLSDRGGDPDVERLLEGFAFLAARIRERTDAAVPEVIHGLTQLLFPHYLRPIPACSVVKFLPHAKALRAPVRLPKGTEVSAAPIDGTACQFRTTSDVTLLPGPLSPSSLAYPSASAPALQAILQSSQEGSLEWLQAGSLRCFLQGEFSVTSMIFLWLFRYCRGIELRNPDQPSASVRLNPASLQAVGFDRGESLFPWPKLSAHGYRMLQEFFPLPKKFLFFDLRGIEAGAALSKRRLEIRFEFDRPPPLPSPINPDLLQLHCAPVVNLFEAK